MAEEVSKEVLNAVLQSAAQFGFEVLDVTYKKEGKDFILSVIIDKEDGIFLDDCANLSQDLSEVLDKNDLICGQYFLDVSSAGAERPLKTLADFKKAIDKSVFIEVLHPIDGMHEFLGVLFYATEAKIVVQIKIKARKKKVEIAMENILRARFSVMLN